MNTTDTFTADDLTTLGWMNHVWETADEVAAADAELEELAERVGVDLDEDEPCGYCEAGGLVNDETLMCWGCWVEMQRQGALRIHRMILDGDHAWESEQVACTWLGLQWTDRGRQRFERGFTKIGGGFES